MGVQFEGQQDLVDVLCCKDCCDYQGEGKGVGEWVYIDYDFVDDGNQVGDQVLEKVGCFLCFEGIVDLDKFVDEQDGCD